MKIGTLQLSYLVDELTFGEWWNIRNVEDACCGSSENEILYALDWLSAFSTVEDELTAKAARWLFESISSYSHAASCSFRRDPPRRLPHSEPSLLRWSAADSSVVLDMLQRAAQVMRPGVGIVSRRIAERWGLSNDLTGRSCESLCEAMGFSVGRIELVHVPDGLSARVDQAAFIPTPPSACLKFFLSRSFAAGARSDASLASRTLLAIAHELGGHARDFENHSRGRVGDVTDLDREALEGWGIWAERLVAGLGDEEEALYLLYQVKRLLPLAWSQLAVDERSELRFQINRVWPEFFVSPETGVFRHALGVHARGLFRVRTAVDSFGSDGARSRVPIWTRSRSE